MGQNCYYYMDSLIQYKNKLKQKQKNYEKTKSNDDNTNDVSG